MGPCSPRPSEVQSFRSILFPPTALMVSIRQPPIVKSIGRAMTPLHLAGLRPGLTLTCYMTRVTFNSAYHCQHTNEERIHSLKVVRAPPVTVPGLACSVSLGIQLVLEFARQNKVFPKFRLCMRLIGSASAVC